MSSRSAATRSAGSALRRALHETFVFPQRFADAADEAAFREAHRRQFSGYRQATIVVGLLIWLAILPLEMNQRALAPAVYTDDVWQRMVAVRLAVAAVFAVGLALTFTPLFRREPASTFVMLAILGAMAGGLLAMTFAVVPYPFNYIYYFTNLYGLLIALYAFTHVLSRPASALGLAILGIVVACTVASAQPRREVDSALVSYLVLLLICHGVGVKFERYERERFRRERQLTGAVEEEQTARRLAAEQSARADEQRELLLQMKEEQRRFAERASAEKSLFLAEAAHDLRQPMHALGNLLESACDAAAKDDPARVRELVRLAQHAARMMRGSFNAVLEVSRLESGGVSPRYEEFDLLELVDEVVTTLQPLAVQRGVGITLRARSGVRLIVRSDRQLMNRVLCNLLSNAIKYADPHKPAGPRLVVGAVCLPTRVRLDVVDNGIGIARRDWDAIFKPFKQLDNPQHDREKGLGLGLTIVNAIVGMLEEHRLDMRSTVGRGTRFSIDVPLRRVEAAAPPSVAAPQPAADGLAGLYVLLVEDDALVRASTVTLLEQHGLLFEAVGSAEELAALLPTLEREPDAVLTDYRLPNANTAADVLALVEREFGRPLPTVVVTGEVGPLAALAGLDEPLILRKPVAPAELLNALARQRLRGAATAASAA